MCGQDIMVFLIVLTALSLYEDVVGSSQDDLVTRRLIHSLLNQTTYDPAIRPLQSGLPTIVEIDFEFTGIGPLLDTVMEMTASFHFRQQWTDTRLEYTELNRSIIISHKYLKSLWVPDLYFPHTNTETGFDVTTPNILLRLYPNGTVLYSQRLLITVRCLMDLIKFPHDQQKCRIQVESYGHTNHEMTLIWSTRRSPLAILSDVFIPDFKLVNMTTQMCEAKFQTGLFPCLFAELQLQRATGYYVTQTYIPSFLIVTLSWVSFWIDYDAVPARISVGLLTVLTTTTQSAGVRAELPKVPYVKAIDVWLVSCLIFVFAAYMEYAVVTVLARRHRKLYVQGAPDLSVNNNLPIEYDKRKYTLKKPNEITGKTLREQKTVDHCSARTVEKVSRYAFPLGFLCFNLVYWIYYSFSPDYEKSFFFHCFIYPLSIGITVYINKNTHTTEIKALLLSLICKLQTKLKKSISTI